MKNSTIAMYVEPRARALQAMPYSWFFTSAYCRVKAMAGRPKMMGPSMGIFVGHFFRSAKMHGIAM